MITGITRIRGLGVYHDYARPAGMQDFSRKNLIYGWNYSGKTTLSRLFAQLESGAQNPDLSGSRFAIETDGGQVTESNFTQVGLKVRVFNSDFIRDNLNFTGESFKPILLLGKETREAQLKLDHCNRLIEKAKEKSSKASNDVAKLEELRSKSRTKAASRIKKTLGLVESYTATHLTKDQAVIEASNESKLQSERVLRNDLKVALTPNSDKPSVISRITVDASLESLYQDAVELLSSTPELASTIEHLKDNPLIERWVETGLSIHRKKNNCEFCGGFVTERRLAELGAHFSTDLADHKNRIEALLRRVEAAEISVSIPDESKLNPQFRERFNDTIAPLKSAINAFNETVRTLARAVAQKAEAPFQEIHIEAVSTNLAETVASKVQATNKVIEENNEMAANFTEAKRNATHRARFHYVQEFLDEQKELGHARQVAVLRNRLRRLRRFIAQVKTDTDELRVLISQAHLGREQINRRLSSMLGSEAIQINVVPDGEQERFQLVRNNGKIAKNLSEGEKTTIAFCYFLTKLKELDSENFSKTIVYIDDPISSLDANHVFQVNAAIRELFFCQDEHGRWTTSCEQIFISTHNFEFFHLLRELKPNKSAQAQLFLINRVASERSTIGSMPESLSRYASEYHFLFEIIYKFDRAPEKTDYEKLMLLPNAMRRFVELYTYSRLPGPVGSTVDQRAEIIFGAEESKRILKIFHYFSHANNMDRLAGNSELIFDVQSAVRDLLALIQNADPHHWNALMEAVEN